MSSLVKMLRAARASKREQRRKADAALAASDLLQVLAVEKGSRRKCSQCLELIGSLVVAGTRQLHAIHEPNTHNMVIPRGIVKNGRETMNRRTRRNTGFQGATGHARRSQPELPRQMKSRFVPVKVGMPVSVASVTAAPAPVPSAS
jgi:hypothetical protein